MNHRLRLTAAATYLLRRVCGVSSASRHRHMSVATLLVTGFVATFGGLLSSGTARAASLQAPADGQASSTRVTLRWNLASGEDAWQLFVGASCADLDDALGQESWCQDPTGAKTELYNLQPNQTSLTVSIPLSAGHVYYWAVGTCETIELSGASSCGAASADENWSEPFESGIANSLTKRLAVADVSDAFEDASPLSPDAPWSGPQIIPSRKIQCHADGANHTYGRRFTCTIKERWVKGTATLVPTSSGATSERISLRDYGINCYDWDLENGTPCPRGRLKHYRTRAYQICDTTAGSGSPLWTYNHSMAASLNPNIGGYCQIRSK